MRIKNMEYKKNKKYEGNEYMENKNTEIRKKEHIRIHMSGHGSIFQIVWIVIKSIPTRHTTQI